MVWGQDEFDALGVRMGCAILFLHHCDMNCPRGTSCYEDSQVFEKVELYISSCQGSLCDQQPWPKDRKMA